MKAKLFSVNFLIALFLVIGCNPPEPPIPEEEFPQKISFTEFSLIGDACQWENFESGKVIVINSTDELRNFILCRDDGRFYHIDFSKYSFLLLKGSAESAVFFIETDFSKQATKEYTLNLKIHTDVSDVVQVWILAGIVPKITSGASIVLNTQELQDNSCTEVDLMGTRWIMMDGIIDTQTGLIIRNIAGAASFTIRFDTIIVGEPNPSFPHVYRFNASGTRGNFEFDSNTCTYLFIRPFWSSAVGDTGFSRLMTDAFRRVQFFTLRNTEPRIILLHDNDGRNILRYKEIENE